MRESKIVVVDYGRGNLNSVSKALEKVGARVEVSSSPSALRRARAIVLPGVGAFGDAMAALKRLKLALPLREAFAQGKPMLGICLGLQLFYEASPEYGSHQGFGFLKGRVRKFKTGLKVPHMGWNQVRHLPGSPLFKGVAQDANFYFVHSFYAPYTSGAADAGWTRYGAVTFTSAARQGSLFGTQFHPEKSQAAGLRVFKNFWDYAISH